MADSSTGMTDSISEDEVQRLLGGGWRANVCKLALADGTICARCILCVCGVKNGAIFMNSVTTLRSILCKVFVEEEGKKEAGGCAMCLGILMRAEDAVSAVVRRVQELGYERKTLSTFMFSLSIPSACIIRQALVCAHLEKSMESKNLALVVGGRAGGLRDMGVDIKEAFRGVVSGSIESALESRMYNESSAEGAGRLNITIEYVHPESSDDRETLLEGQHFTRTVRGKRQGVRKGEVIPVENNNAVMAEIAKTSKQELMARFGNNMPSVPKSRADSTVQLEREPVYIGGSYCKYSREVSQTPWNEKYGKLELSVQSLIADQIVEVYKPQQVKFMAAGREDVDVRMLGDGRPFLLEVVNAKDLPISPHCNDAIMMGAAAARPPIFEELENKINTSTDLIKVLKFRNVGKEYVKMLKNAGETKTKTYQALVWMEKDVPADLMARLSKSEPFVINQTTPIRVLHRRSLSIRQRTIYSIKCERINSHFMLLHLETEAGTYIKEFVHGDLGRTRPNIAELLDCGDADILQLDVDKSSCAEGS